jgi:hypothetical protein
MTQGTSGLGKGSHGVFPTNVRHFNNDASDGQGYSEDKYDVKYLDCYNNLDFKNK